MFQRWMINHLYNIPFRVFAIKTPGAITVCLRHGPDLDVTAVKIVIPVVNQFRFVKYKPYMIEPLDFVRFMVCGHQPVQGQIIIAGTKVNIVGVRPPLDFHSQQVNIEPFTLFEPAYIECNVMHTTGCCRSCHSVIMPLIYDRGSAPYTSVTQDGRFLPVTGDGMIVHSM